MLRTQPSPYCMGGQYACVISCRCRSMHPAHAQYLRVMTASGNPLKIMVIKSSSERFAHFHQQLSLHGSLARVCDGQHAGSPCMGRQFTLPAICKHIASPRVSHGIQSKMGQAGFWDVRLNREAGHSSESIAQAQDCQNRVLGGTVCPQLGRSGSALPDVPNDNL